MRYFKRPRDESRGDEFDAWGASFWYFEVGADAYPVRQLEVYENGTTLKYDETYLDDQYGGLSDQPLELEDFLLFEVEQRVFEEAWQKAQAINR